MVLLADLCVNIPQPEYTVGRPRFPLADMVHTGATKVYSGFSARRFDCDVRQAFRQGLISAAPNVLNGQPLHRQPGLDPGNYRLDRAERRTP